MLNMLDGVRLFAATARGMAFLLASLGFVTWTILSLWAGLTTQDAAFRLGEAWDTAAYFYVGVPVMALTVAIAAFLHPERAWRWPLSLVAGHQIGVLLLGLGMQSGLSLLLLTLILAVLLAVFFAIPAFIGATAARRLTERAY